jgi:hypothetical protein
LGSVFGAVTCLSRFFVQFFRSWTLTDSNSVVDCAVPILDCRIIRAYVLEFLYLSVAKLLVLHRMSNFAAAKGDVMSRRLALGGRVVIAAVVLGNVLGFCGNVATAVSAKKCGDAYNFEPSCIDI